MLNQHAMVKKKSPLRSTMGQECLDGLAMIFYHRDKEFTTEEVVEDFSRHHTRQMLLQTIIYHHLLNIVYLLLDIIILYYYKMAEKRV